MNTSIFSGSTIRKKYLDFFAAKAHTIIDNARLIPENDPSALFISAGMHPLVPYLMGQAHPSGTTRLANIQKCLRTGDIDEVGKTRRHLTFFEMAGNWSLGDYFKKESITWSFELLTEPQWYDIDPQRLYVTVFKGDADAEKDTTSIDTWTAVFAQKGITAQVAEDPENSPVIERISCYSKKSNWWGPVSKTGPCGPDSEIFYDTGKPHNPEFGPYCHPNCDCGRFIEIWNNVFMEFIKQEDGNYLQAPKQNVDTGLGVERVALILQFRKEDGSVPGDLTIFSTDLFTPMSTLLIKHLFTEDLSEPFDTFITTTLTNSEHRALAKVVIEHIRAATFLSAEGLEPANKDQGYVLRRLIRRAIRSLNLLTKKYNPERNNVIQPLLVAMAQAVIDHYTHDYPHLKEKEGFIKESLNKEITKFLKALEQGTVIFDKTPKSELSAKLAFDLYQSYGFPFELTQEMAAEQGVTITEQQYNEEKAKHQEISKQGLEKRFAGGLGDTSAESVQFHTLTHLLHVQLRSIFGEEAHQQGSNITAERLRFDINAPRKLTTEEIEKIEQTINGWIAEKLPVEKQVVTPKEADTLGAFAFFKEKYGDTVNVYLIGNKGNYISIERCGGPHVNNLGEITKQFKISKQEKIGTGILRIKGVLV